MSIAENLLIVFFVKGCKVALPVSDFKEIAEELEIVRAPAESFLAGSVALRGHEYPLIDIRKRLGLGELDSAGSMIFLLLNTLGGVCVFPADGLVGVSEQTKEVYSVPEFAFKDSDMISSFMMQGEDIVSILNLEAVMRDIL